MKSQEDLAEHGLREPGDGKVIDLCAHIPTEALYVIKWSEANGQMLALHGPIRREETSTLDLPRLAWTADHDLDWARTQQWRQIEVLAEQDF